MGASHLVELGIWLPVGSLGLVNAPKLNVGLGRLIANWAKRVEFGSGVVEKRLSPSWSRSSPGAMVPHI